MVKPNDKYYVTVTYDYYEYTPDGDSRYKYINEKRRTGEAIIPEINNEPRYKMNIYNISKCLIVEGISIAKWYEDYKKAVETTGYTEGVFGEDRENRVIYCKDNYYRMRHEVNGEWAYSEPMWAIINEEGFLWDPTQIYNYYFPELDECNKPLGRYFVRSMDINPKSLTYTQIRIVEVKITEGIIRTEKDSGDKSNKYINVYYNKDEDRDDTILIHTE